MMEKLLKFYVIFDLYCLISLLLGFIIYVSIMIPHILFFTIPAVIFIICISIKSIKLFIYERKVVNELLNFDTIEEGIECLTIAQNLVDEFNQNNDTIYATRIQLRCVEQIIKKLNDIGWEGDNCDRNRKGANNLALEKRIDIGANPKYDSDDSEGI